jgi:hypothetical protein
MPQGEVNLEYQDTKKLFTYVQELWSEIVFPTSVELLRYSQQGKVIADKLPPELYINKAQRQFAISVLYLSNEFRKYTLGVNRIGASIGFRPFRRSDIPSHLPLPTFYAALTEIDSPSSLSESSTPYRFNFLTTHARGHELAEFVATESLGKTVTVGIMTQRGSRGDRIGQSLTFVMPEFPRDRPGFWIDAGNELEEENSPSLNENVKDLNYDYASLVFKSAADELSLLHPVIDSVE